MSNLKFTAVPKKDWEFRGWSADGVVLSYDNPLIVDSQSEIAKKLLHEA